VVEGGSRSNVVAAESKAIVDVRVPDQEEARRVKKAISNLRPATPGVTLHVEGGIGRPAMERTLRNRRLWERARELGARIGVELEEGIAGGTSDGNATSLFTATLDGLGAVGGGAHALHEFIYIDKLVERSALLALLLIEPSLNERSGA
jgi:glutamate carboxypeptidase